MFQRFDFFFSKGYGNFPHALKAKAEVAAQRIPQGVARPL